MRKDPKSAKTEGLSAFFALLGFLCVKAARKHVDEIDPWGQSYKRNVVLRKDKISLYLLTIYYFNLD